MATFDSPLLIIGAGPAALVAAKVASGAGLASLLVGDVPRVGQVADPVSVELGDPVELNERSIAILERDGVLGVLRPYAASQDPFAIASPLFCDGLKHHCVADMLITVFDGMALSGSVGEVAGGGAIQAAFDDGRRTWDITADACFDATDESEGLNQAIAFGATFAESLLARLGVTGR